MATYVRLLAREMLLVRSTMLTNKAVVVLFCWLSLYPSCSDRLTIYENISDFWTVYSQSRSGLSGSVSSSTARRP